MSEREELVVRYGLREDERPEAARIFLEAFDGKMGPVLGSAPTAIPLLERGFTGTAILTAVHRGELVGLAGLKPPGEEYLHLGPRPFIGSFGLGEGLLRYLFWRLMDRRPPENGLLLDTLAVDRRLRGRGIGRRLVAAVFELARERGLAEVALEVVDENPRARRLYERLGFTVRRSYRVPFMRRVMGFGAYTVMTRPVSPVR